MSRTPSSASTLAFAIAPAANAQVPTTPTPTQAQSRRRHDRQPPDRPLRGDPQLQAELKSVADNQADWMILGDSPTRSPSTPQRPGRDLLPDLARGL